MKLIISFFFIYCLFSVSGYSQNNPSKEDTTWNKRCQWTGILDDYLTRTSEHELFNGYAFASDGTGCIVSKAYGFANFDRKQMPGVNTAFMLGSITKQFTAVLVLKQVQNGKIKLDQTIEKYFPGIPNSRKITFRMLLSHTSGLPNFTDFPEFANFPLKTFSHKYVIERISAQAPLFEPGLRFSYCNSGYYLLGVFLEMASGKSFEDLLKEQILQPAKMTRTGLSHPDKHVPAMAIGYKEDILHHVPTEKINMELAFSAGQMYSTINDLLKWSNFLDNTHIINDTLKALLFTPNKDDYGFGWVVRTFPDGSLVRFHTGALPGFRSCIYRIPSKKFTMILLANMDAVSLSDKISIELINYYLGMPYTPPVFHKKIQLDQKLLTPYIGTYQVNQDFSIVVTIEEGKLMVQGTGQDKVEFFPESPESFFVTFTDAKVVFKKNSEGTVTGAEITMGSNTAVASKVK